MTSLGDTLSRVLFLGQCLPLSTRDFPGKKWTVEMTPGEGSPGLTTFTGQMLWGVKEEVSYQDGKWGLSSPALGWLFSIGGTWGEGGACRRVCSVAAV